MMEKISIKGAREHNLKDVSLELPRNQLTVITGLSGSGKSSLAFDTIYAEGQRRYVESLSSYARQFLGLMEKPDVDQIDGLSPAISIDQKSTSRNPRSTVATVTEIYDYLRLLYARIGEPHCPICSKPVERKTLDQIAQEVTTELSGKKLIILAPIIIDKKGSHQHVPERYSKAGFARARVDGVIYDLEEFPEDLDKNKKHSIDVVVDRIALDSENQSRLNQSLEQALDLSDGLVNVLDFETDEVHRYSQMYACQDHPEVSIPELEPRTFSFNSPHGACPTCTGLGSKMVVDESLALSQNLTISEGAIRPFNRMRYDGWNMKLIRAMADEHGFSLRVRVKDMDPDDLQKVLYGTGNQTYHIPLGSGSRTYETTYEGVIPGLERRHNETDSDGARREIEKYMRELPCPKCKGRRLRPESLAVTVADVSIVDVIELSVIDAIEFFDNLELSEKNSKIAEQVLKEICARLSFLRDVGLDYLTLDRSAKTLSGGEAQRIRLATQVGSGLTGVLYVLDEPSIGLHQRDNDRLIGTLRRMRDLGNTVLVVEHDEDTIRAADYLVDIGPGAGIHGGHIVSAGTPAQVESDPKSVTGQYLSGKKTIPVPKKRRPGHKNKFLEVKGAREHNLKNIDIKIPLGEMVVVSGVSGSGKSSLVNDIIAKELQTRLNRASLVPGDHDEIRGHQHLDKAIVIDQSPIGRTPRSNTATYTGVFTTIRELFAETPESNIRGYKPGRFSFNVKGGRCEKCRGDGMLKIEMHFLPDVYVPCEECKGRRYNREALEIHYKGKNISEVLDMTVETAHEFFANIPSVERKLKTLVDVGLGYIGLGQPATTLSGGEAQRIKLASELSKRSTGKTLYILDEPTTGLHIADVAKLLEVLNRLVDNGNSMIIIEHNLDVIKSADYIVDIGPEGGDAGGQIMAQGTPEEIAKVKDSHTGQYLAKILK